MYLMHDITNGVGRPPNGWISDHIGRANVMGIAFGIGAVCNARRHGLSLPVTADAGGRDAEGRGPRPGARCRVQGRRLRVRPSRPRYRRSPCRSRATARATRAAPPLCASPKRKSTSAASDVRGSVTEELLAGKGVTRELVRLDRYERRALSRAQAGDP